MHSRATRAFVRIFPDHQAQIKAFIRQNKLKVKKLNDLQMQGLITYCNSVTKPHRRLMKAGPLIILFIFMHSLAAAQGPLISGDFIDLPFDEFTREVEEAGTCKIYLQEGMDQ